MLFILKIANVITNQISNLFQKRGEIDPPALIKFLEREVAAQKKSVDGVQVVPNDYTIFLSEEDCHRLSAARIIKALYIAVERKVIRENFFMDGDLIVRIEKNFENDEAIFIKSEFVAERKKDDDTINLENEILSKTLVSSAEVSDEGTIVADKTKISSDMKISKPKNIDYDLAVLSDLMTQEIILGEKQIYLGRKETNDFVLEDDGASRIHAYISYERHRHILKDAGSLNGTLVNKKQIERCELKNGDKILIGNTVLVYKVLE